MKFVFLLPDGLDARGGVRRVLDYAEMLGRRGHQCVIVSKDESLPEWFSANKYNHFTIRPPSRPYYSITCDVAWATGKRGGLRLRKMRHSALKIYSVVMLESMNRPEHRRDNEDRMLTDPYDQDWLYVANSSWLRNAVKEKSRKCELILAAPRSDMFRPNMKPNPLKGRHAVALCLQSRGYWKGSERSVNAIEHARSKWPHKRRIESWMFGPGLPPKMPRPRRKFGICGVHDLGGLYRAADVVLHSSAFEGWANIPFEAMCCGTPFVTFDTPGIQDFAVDGYNCRIVKQFDEKAMADAILEILLDSRFREHLRWGCIETYKRFCAIDTVSEIERIVVKGLLEKRK